MMRLAGQDRLNLSTTFVLNDAIESISFSNDFASYIFNATLVSVLSADTLYTLTLLSAASDDKNKILISSTWYIILHYMVH